MKKWLKFIPEIYFLISVLYYWSMTSSIWNPFAIALLGIIILQLILKSRILGVLLSLLLIFANLFMFLALLSEYHEFNKSTKEARELLLFGSLYLGTNLLMAVLLLIKYAIREVRETNTKAPFMQ